MIVIHDNRFSGAEPRKALLEAKIWMLEAYKSTDSDFIETFADFYKNCRKKTFKSLA